MHVITRRRLVEFIEKYPTAESGLEHWHRLMKRNDFISFIDLRRTFPSADQVDNLTVFNISGNNFRLIAAIHYNTGRVYIRHVLTHSEYDRGQWKE